MKKMGRLQSMSLKHKILAVILTGFLVLFLAGIVSLEFVSNSYEKKLYNSIAASLTDSALEISDQLKYIDTIVDSILANQTYRKAWTGQAKAHRIRKSNSVSTRCIPRCVIISLFSTVTPSLIFP